MPKDNIDKILEVLLNFRNSCQDCMWNKEEPNNQNCKTCIKDNRQAIWKEIKELNYSSHQHGRYVYLDDLKQLIIGDDK